MKSKISLLLAIVMIAFSVSQCKKKKAEEEPAENTPNTPTSTALTSIAQVFTVNGSPTQNYTVDASLASTLTVNGVKVEIPANAFVTSTGGTLTGVVDVSVRTILTKAQIILSGAGANSSSSKLVTTKGCVKVTASQNTQSLRLGAPGTVNVKIPDGSTLPANMKKYYASKVSATDTAFVWDLGADITNIPIALDTMAATFQHNASLDSLKWLNVGVLWDSLTTNKSPVIINTDTIFKKTNCAIYVSINGSLTVGAASQLIPGKFRIANIPDGRGVHVIGIGVVNGQLYFDAISVITGTGAVNLNMQPKSLSQIQTLLSAIP